MKNRMIIWVVAVVFFAGFASWFGQSVQASDRKSNDLAALERLAGRWIALRAELSQEEQTWEAQQEHWKREMDLLRAEIAQRDALLKDHADAVSSEELQQSDLLAETEHIEAELASLEQVVSQHEELLRGWRIRIPVELQAQAGMDFTVLPSNDAASVRVGILRRLQVVLALYAQIEELQNTVHVVRAMLELGASKREVDILYFGLARGFAVSGSGDWAAFGTADVDGWHWQEAPGAADYVRDAIQVRTRDADTRFVDLPLEIRMQP